MAARAFQGLASAVLGISGGADSMTLLVLARALRHVGNDMPIVVATVDHGLRPGSAAESRWVAEQAKAAGFEHRMLPWAGPKPSSGIQDAARVARYGLLASLVDRESLPRPVGILLGHHLDDQAETFLMRLGRGSGLDGLAGMAEVRSLPNCYGIELVRPFLAIAKSRLVATLQAHGIAWIEDPSNQDPAFERVRIRKALAELAALGIGAHEIGLTMRRLARARDAIRAETEALLLRSLHVHGGAFGRIAASVFDEATADVSIRLVQRLIVMFGGPDERPRLARIEELADRLSSDSCTATLAGCRISRTGEDIQAVREPGRRGLAHLELSPGGSAVWDGRFRVSAAASRPRAVTVRSLSTEDLACLRRVHAVRGSPPRLSMPRAAALTLPSFWEGQTLLGVCHPALGQAFSGALDGLSASFVHV